MNFTPPEIQALQQGIIIFTVMERTVGGIVFDDGGVRWSPLREIILQPGVFHG